MLQACSDARAAAQLLVKDERLSSKSAMLMRAVRPPLLQQHTRLATEA